MVINNPLEAKVNQEKHIISNIFLLQTKHYRRKRWEKEINDNDLK